MSRPIPLSQLRPSPSIRFLHEEPENFDEDGIFSHSLSFEGVEQNQAPLHPKWRHDLFALMEQPASSPPAFFVHIFITSLIILSSFVTVLETIPAFHSVAGSVWFGFETSLVALFTIEYIARCISWSGTWLTFAKWVACEHTSDCFVLSFSDTYPQRSMGSLTYWQFCRTILRSCSNKILCVHSARSTVRLNHVSSYLVRLLSFLNPSGLPAVTSISTIPLE